MAKQMESLAKRPRISIDVRPELRRRLLLAAAKHDRTVQKYILEAIEGAARGGLQVMRVKQCWC